MPSVNFRSILSEDTPNALDASGQAPECLTDLNLDQIVDAIIGSDDEYALKPFFLAPLATTYAVEYRHEIMRDLENDQTFGYVTEFASAMRRVREHLAKATKLHCILQSQRLFLDATQDYSQAVIGLSERLSFASANSRGLRAFRKYLFDYVGSPSFRSRASEAHALLDELANLCYSVHVKENVVTVGRYEEQPDYSAEVTESFAKFRQGDSQSYRVETRDSVEMNHVEERILSLVARLFPNTFAKLAEFRERHKTVIDSVIAEFDREIQFYIAYICYMRRFTSSGLPFCYPEIFSGPGATFARDTFDAALACRLLERGETIVVNDFDLRDEERIIVVSGPNQGGKTTFARAFGQLHYLASLGCPVPGSSARLGTFDRIYTHFEREERVENLRSKLEDDLLRIHDVLLRATPRSIIVINEIFSSTTTSDAYFLAQQVVDRILRLGARCACVTFLEALASADERIVSMVSTVSAEDPAVRTYKVVRRVPGGRSYAASIAEKHGLTYERVKSRIGGRGQ